MENFEYSKTFPSKVGDADNLAYDEAEAIRNFLLNYERELKDTPQFLLPYAPAIFEKTLADCEQIAEEFGGRIKAKIDYSFFSATIELWCPYVEFAREEFMSILHEIALLAISVRFTPLTSGELHIAIQMPYFASARDLAETD